MQQKGLAVEATIKQLGHPHIQIQPFQYYSLVLIKLGVKPSSSHHHLWTLNWLCMRRTSSTNASGGKNKYKNRNEKEVPPRCCYQIIFSFCAEVSQASPGLVPSIPWKKASSKINILLIIWSSHKNQEGKKNWEGMKLPSLPFWPFIQEYMSFKQLHSCKRKSIIPPNCKITRTNTYVERSVFMGDYLKDMKSIHSSR